jgi:hypothetical protein
MASTHKLRNDRDEIGVTADDDLAALDAAYEWSKHTGSDVVKVYRAKDDRQIGQVTRMLFDHEREE